MHTVGPDFVRRHLERAGWNLDLIHVHWPSHTAQTPVERGLGRFGALEWVLSATASEIRINPPSRPKQPNLQRDLFSRPIEAEQGGAATMGEHHAPQHPDRPR